MIKRSNLLFSFLLLILSLNFISSQVSFTNSELYDGLRNSGVNLPYDDDLSGDLKTAAKACEILTNGDQPIPYAFGDSYDYLRGKERCIESDTLVRFDGNSWVTETSAVSGDCLEDPRMRAYLESLRCIERQENEVSPLDSISSGEFVLYPIYLGHVTKINSLGIVDANLTTSIESAKKLCNDFYYGSSLYFISGETQSGNSESCNVQMKEYVGNDPYLSINYRNQPDQTPRDCISSYRRNYDSLLYESHEQIVCAQSLNVVSVCNDGIDNEDMFPDGLIDADDPGCKEYLGVYTNGTKIEFYVPHKDNELSMSDCDDEIDNDLNGLIDADDPGCWRDVNDPKTYYYKYAYEGVVPYCSDGIDNDGDGWIDLCENDRSNFLTCDPDCTDDRYENEFNTRNLECMDGIDNDNDGKIDYCTDGFNGTCDIDCVRRDAGTEGPNSPCNDGIDNDGDILFDYCNGTNQDTCDPSCTWYRAPENEFNGLVKFNCSDGIDNDGDNLFDYCQDDNYLYCDPDCTGPEDDEEPKVDYNNWAYMDGERIGDRSLISRNTYVMLKSNGIVQEIFDEARSNVLPYTQNVWMVDSPFLIGDFVKFASSTGESELIKIDDSISSEKASVDIIEPACGEVFNLTDNKTIVIELDDRFDLITGHLDVGSYRYPVNNFNGKIDLINYQFNESGNIQLLLTANTSSGETLKFKKNIIVVDNTSLVERKYVASCIDKPKSFVTFDDSRVEFEATSSKGIIFDPATKTISEVDKSNLLFEWNFYYKNNYLGKCIGHGDKFCGDALPENNNGMTVINFIRGFESVDDIYVTLSVKII